MKNYFKTFLIAFIAIIATVAVCYAAEYKYSDLTWITKDRQGREIVNVHAATREITQATDINVMDGYPDGTFRPDEPIKRSEFIRCLLGLLLIELLILEVLIQSIIHGMALM